MNAEKPFSLYIKQLLVKCINWLSLKKQKKILSQDDILSLAPDKIKAIKTMHDYYIHHVSNRVFTLSFESCITLAALIIKLRPRTIWDMGSGFSTHLCRYISDAYGIDCAIITFETSEHWAEKVKKYLQSHHIHAEHHLIEAFNADDAFTHTPTPDLIIHDIGDERNFRIRQTLLTRLGKLCSEGAYVWVDDIHKPEINSACRNTIAMYQLQVQDLSSFTWDTFRRYAWILIPPDDES